VTIPKQLPKLLISFDSPSIEIDTVGGKGANLVILAQAGFPVPDGFLIPTTAYQGYISENQLTSQIQSILDHIDLAEPEELESASKRIREKFSVEKISPRLAEALVAGWHWLGTGPVAVRSSATAEDLPDLSFAGQQDTFLNVSGEDALLAAVTNCWSSLWTARAIGYRTRNHIPHSEVSVSVVVQHMVASEASGVLFTANPLTGLRDQAVIDATLGLGEALVSGQVEPDHYLVDTKSSAISNKTLGSKTLAIYPKSGGGLQTQILDSANVQAISDEAILQIAGIGKKIEQLYQFPQDIEWAWANGQLYILQARPITSLYPIPENRNTDHLQVYFSFGAVQGYLDPLTPLGQDAIRLIFAGAASLLGFNEMNHHSQGVIKIAGERLWGNTTAVIRHPIGAKIILKIFPGIEPGSLEGLKEILADPKIGAGSGKLRFRTFLRLANFGSRMLRRMIYFAHNPEDKAQMVRSAYQDQVELLRKKYKDPEKKALSLEECINLFREIQNAFIYAVPEIAAVILPGLLPLIFLSKIATRIDGSDDLALEVTRGLPNNVTTEMDLALWETAKAIRLDPTSYQVMTSNTTEILSEYFLENKLPETAQKEIMDFLQEYGVRGLGEIDIGRPRWRENPSQIMNTLKSYIQINDPEKAPDVVFQRGAARAQAAVDALIAGVTRTFGGKLKARAIKAAVRRVRALGGLRESPKFYIIQLMGIIRQGLLNCGKELVRQALLEKEDDLFFLNLDELEAFSLREARDWKAVIQQHRNSYQREMLRRQIPRLIVSDGRTYYEGISAKDLAAGVLRGSPVSPGVVEGMVRVVLDPHQSNLMPGEILVCPGTDPAWTPLFLAASGLVMEVGGLMTHGAIVAREYGIPAVVGVNQATQVLKTGQRIRINGSSGLIERIE
jgi:phosphohistidine swiveling domain-containing protein